jgi:transcriptional regulator with XRE-family HTH domain
MTVGERIKQHRLEKGWTQEELGKHLGVGKAAIQKYESGQVQNLKSSTIKTLCELFDARPFDFIFDDLELDGKPEIQVVNSACEELMNILPKLNSTAHRKLVDYATDLCEISKYRK